MSLHQLRIGRRLALAFGAIVALMFIAAGVAFERFKQLDASSQQVVELQRRAGLAESWRAHTHLNASRALAIVKASASEQITSHFDPQMRATTETISAIQKELSQLVTSEQERKLLATIAERRSAYIADRQVVLNAIRAGDALAAQSALQGRMLPASEAYVASIGALAQYETQLSDAANTQLHDQVQQAGWLVLGLTAVAALLAGWLGRVITRSITAPLQVVVGHTERIAGGNLAEPVQAQGRDEAAEVLRSLDRMQTALRRLVGEVRMGSDSIATASVQIATGNQDLSSRTEQTASALQETASSLEQLTGTVGQTADSARTANQLALSATTAAQRGGTVVGQVVQTMQAINGSSSRIADIIGTIDGIAFQTNILALNAAVEAARAGEQGRGFAVVAGEVRNLAQRSAEAAREIKGLIQASVQDVEAGSRLVAEAGDTMNSLVASVQRVGDVIGEISAATAEQSTGLKQVNDAVANLDRMTQQNAALVEESAAAAQAMADQSQRLTSLVASFRTGHDTPAAAPAPAATAAPARLAAHTIQRARTAPPSKPGAAPRTARPAKAPAARAALPAAAPAPATVTAAAAAKPVSGPATSALADDDWQTF